MHRSPARYASGELPRPLFCVAYRCPMTGVDRAQTLGEVSALKGDWVVQINWLRDGDEPSS